MNLSPERIAKRRALKMNHVPEPTRILKLVIRRDVEKDLEIERRLKDLDRTGKIKVDKTVRTTKNVARGASDFDAPSILIENRKPIIGVIKIEKFLAEL